MSEIFAFNSEKCSREYARKMLALEANEIVIGFLGCLAFDKGVDLLIEAMSILKKKSIPCVLVLAGEGSQRKSLEKSAAEMHVEDRVRFLGFLKDVPAFMCVFFAQPQ
ncbi:MAG: glycosyltransferase [Sedimentisphaerales bacterium]|nr:glycosyltransferase [Sedimentisphaerales bacterium]